MLFNKMIYIRIPRYISITQITILLTLKVQYTTTREKPWNKRQVFFAIYIFPQNGFSNENFCIEDMVYFWALLPGFSRQQHMYDRLCKLVRVNMRLFHCCEAEEKWYLFHLNLNSFIPGKLKSDFDICGIFTKIDGIFLGYKSLKCFFLAAVSGCVWFIVKCCE